MSAAFSKKFKERQPSEWGITSGFALAMVGLFGPQFFLGPLFPLTIGLLPFTQNELSAIGRIIFDVLTILTIFILVRLYGQNLSKIGLGRFKPWPFLRAMLIGFGVYYLFISIGMELILWLLPINGDEVQQLGFADLSTWEMVLAFLSLVVIVPVAEEIVFRGFLFTGLRRRLPFWATALLVSVLFGWVHGQWNVGIDVFLLSLVLCGLREYTASLWPAIMLHAVKNGVAFYLLYLYNGG